MNPYDRDTLNQRTAEALEQLSDVRAAADDKVCPDCGAVWALDAVGPGCPTCGLSLEDLHAAAAFARSLGVHDGFCRNCRETIPLDQDLCHDCQPRELVGPVIGENEPQANG